MSKETTKKMRAKTTIAALTALALACFAAAPAFASQAIESFTTTTSTNQAGGHPDLFTSFKLEDPGEPEAARNVIYNAPEGVFGNPNATTRCQQADFALDSCPPNSQVGIVTIRANHSGNPELRLGTGPVYSVATDEDETALFALNIPVVDIPVLIPVEVRDGSDYGLRFTVSELSQTIPIAQVDLTLWGFPAIDEHNFERFRKGSPGNPPGCPFEGDTTCIGLPTAVSTDPPSPLISNPTICTGEPLVTKLSVQTFQDPGTLTHATSSYPETDGCEALLFNPFLQGTPTTTETDAPSGLDLTMRSPQFLNFAAAPSQIKQVTTTLPPGLTINPDAADGQTACSDEQANFGKDIETECPDSSKIGTFEVETPALDGPLVGDLYIGEPKPGNQYRLFMTANGFGINAKLVGSILPDPQTGQITFQTQQLPQVAFEEFRLHLFSSDRGLMATPIQCRIYDIKAHFLPWNDALADQTSTQHFALDSGPNGTDCPGIKRNFTPRLEAGTSNPVAGAFSNFALKLDRDDGDQFLGDLNFTMPPGFTGDLKGISYCSEASIASAAANLGKAEQASPSCPSSSQIGTTNVAAGPGSHPFHAVGKMYLAGPLKGAPLSIAAITPALAGPYDYGNVVVRVALHVDPLTAQVRALSERMPQIIGGIPIRMRSIRVNIDREKFTINPTNCSNFTVDSQGVGDQGTAADFSSPFTAVNCATLPFGPKMTITQLGKKKDTKRSRNPRLRFDLRTRPGDANIKSVSVTLPQAFAIDQRHLGNICSKAELEASLCEGAQPIGNAWVKTPLLDQPLSGPAYAVSGFGGLPRLAFILQGQVMIIPQAESSSVRAGKGARLRTVVPVVPDAPIGHFRLTLLGGKQGYLANTRDLCIAPASATVSYTAQSGKELTQRVKAKTRCGSKSRKGKRASKRHR